MAGGVSGQIVDGRFELLEQLGAGGMGAVWRARDTTLDREVALKEVSPPDPATAPDGSEHQRMLREARALARLSHPHVVTVHQIVDARPYPWLVLELVPGRSLQERLDGGPLSVPEAARIGSEVLSALRAAHAAGICHRDVKPANVLLRGDGRAVLTDFGIAAFQGSTTLTATGQLVGSPEYIAPERIRGADDDGPPSDLWSLGHGPLRVRRGPQSDAPLQRARHPGGSTRRGGAAAGACVGARTGAARPPRPGSGAAAVGGTAGGAAVPDRVRRSG